MRLHSVVLRCHAEGVSREPIVSTTSGRLYRERLWPGPLGWFIVVGAGLFGFIALLPVTVTAAAVAAAVAVACGVAAAVAMSPVVENGMD